MQELIDVTFETKKLPDGWLEEKHNYTFEQGALRSDWATVPKFILPGKGWEQLRVEVDVEPLAGALITCGDSIATIVVDLGRCSHCITSSAQTRLVENTQDIPKKKGKYRVVFEFYQGHLRGLVDGQEVIVGKSPRYTFFSGLIELGFWDDCLIHRVRILGKDELEKPVYTYPQRKKDDFFLEVNVDFVDNIIPAPYTEEMFERLFAEFKNWGVKRCHWIYYGGIKNHLWEAQIYNLGLNFNQTVKNAGEPFNAAVKAAHAYDIEIYGLIKPLDMGPGRHSFGENTEEARKYGKLKRIGGYIDWIADFATQHREFIISRKPGDYKTAENNVFNRIDLVKKDAKPAVFNIKDISLYVSDDNVIYKLYTGPIKREEVVEDYPVWEHTASGGRPMGKSRKSLVMRFKNLQISNKYVALMTNSRANSFSNSLINLIHVFGEKGEERCLTYGVHPRRVYNQPKNFDYKKPDLGLSAPADFREAGIEFDMFGLDGAVSPGYDPIQSPHIFDSQHGFLAVARGKNDGPIAVLSPSFPEVRQWWLSWVKEILEAGADGVELRMRHHNRVCAWGEYGFEKPVRDEFKKRHGVDIWETDDFDKNAFRRLRGEAYTEFYREAKKLTASYGKPLGLHVSLSMNMEPEKGAPMDMHFDWRQWLEEGLADSVTMKEVWPRTRFAEEILSYTRPRNIPVIFCPYANNIWNKPGGEKICAERIRLARENGFDGFQFYECAAVVKATPEGKLNMTQPALREVFRKEFRK